MKIRKHHSTPISLGYPDKSIPIFYAVEENCGSILKNNIFPMQQ